MDRAARATTILSCGDCALHVQGLVRDLRSYFIVVYKGISTPSAGPRTGRSPQAGAGLCASAYQPRRQRTRYHRLRRIRIFLNNSIPRLCHHQICLPFLSLDFLDEFLERPRDHDLDLDRDQDAHFFIEDLDFLPYLEYLRSYCV